MYKNMIIRKFGDYYDEKIYTFNQNFSSEKKEKVDFSLLLSRSDTELTFMHYLNQKELFRISLRKLMVPSGPITGIHNYLKNKAMEEFGVDKYGLYILDSNFDKSKFCNRKLKGAFTHKSSIIHNILDYDLIDTENTDYTYIVEEDNFYDNVDSSQIDIIEGNSLSESLSDNCETITFNGKVLSMYETEVLGESITAPDSN